MKKTIALVIASFYLIVGGFPHKAFGEEVKSVILEHVAQSARQWTGIAVMPDARIFVNFPRWSDNVPVSVGELLSDGSVRAFPNAEWNSGAPAPENRFVCVQSVVADREGYLWVLDSGNPKFSGVVPGAPKLLKFDPVDGRLVAKILSRGAGHPPKKLLERRSDRYCPPSGLPHRFRDGRDPGDRPAQRHKPTPAGQSPLGKGRGD